jgi:dolichyl-phosphate beta-glucosyltransferase
MTPERDDRPKAPPRVVVVVPCFDEAARLPGAAFRSFVAAHPETGFLFVDDGSRDQTLARLRELAESDPVHLRVLPLARNQGKAEAVRQGLLAALKEGPAFVGYWDADLATPLEEIPRFLAVFQAHPERAMVLGSRVRMLGRAIDRRWLRHYLGRVFATAASWLLDLAVYDTQCGAKMFRVDDDLELLFAEPFRSRWIFDVELLARLGQRRRARGRPGPQECVYELPLDRWHDAPGSKVRPTDFLRAFVDLVRIHRAYRSPRRPVAGPTSGG